MSKRSAVEDGSTLLDVDATKKQKTASTVDEADASSSGGPSSSSSSTAATSKDDLYAEALKGKYVVGKELGRGAFSVVRLGTSPDGNQVAIKIVSRSDVGEDMNKHLVREIDILKKVDHPNIISLLEMVETDAHIFFVMELVTGGELFDTIVEKGCYTEADARRLVTKIIEAVKYLHGQGIAHRDLKPENLLVSSEDDTEVKIADFGLSKIYDDEKIMNTACGTPGYVAPEVLNADAEGYDNEVDMWSIGVITYILLCGFPPFYSDSTPELFEQILSAKYDYPEKYWKDISDVAKSFIDSLLVVDPAKRLSAAQALEHDWLKSKDSGPDHAGSGGSKTELANFSEKMKEYYQVRKQESKKNAVKNL